MDAPWWHRCRTVSTASSGHTCAASVWPGSGPVLARSHQGQVTLARVVTLCDAVGTAIFRRKVVRLLIDGKDSFMEEARDVLRAGPETAALGDGRDT